MVALLIVSALSVQGPPLPPYLRQATQPVLGSSYDPSFAVAGNVFVVSNLDSCDAYRLPELKRIWSASMPGEESAEFVRCGPGRAYVTTSPAHRKEASSLIAYDLATGRLLWKVYRTGEGSPMALDGGMLYLGMKPFAVSALDLRTRKVKWTASLPKPKDASRFVGAPEAISAAEGRVVLNCGDDDTICLEAKTGKRLWSVDKSFMFRGTLPVASGVVWVPHNNGSVARDLKTGRELWRDPQIGPGDFAGVQGRRFIGLDDGRIFAVDARTGKTNWSHPIGPSNTSGGNQYGAILGSTVFARGIASGAILDGSGRLLWKGANDETIAQPCWTDGKNLVAFDGTRLLRYVQGTSAAVPTDPKARQALAARMVAGWDTLDDAELKKLESLGDDAFRPVFEAFLKACAAYDSKSEGVDSYPLYSKYHEIGSVLAKVAGPKRTKDLMSALGAAKPESSAKPVLLTLLGKYGDPALVTLYFLKEIEGVATPGFEMYESNTYVAREYIKHSKDPRAVAFMIRQLKDPTSDRTMRWEAYLHVAGTGGDEGVKAVLAERSKRRLLPPLAERVLEGWLDAGESGSKLKPAAEKDNWGLLTSGVLGSRGDLWLAEKVGAKWTSPVFLGVSLDGVSGWAKPAPPEPQIAGLTAKQLVAADWLKTLSGNAEIAKDSDGDGLSDLAEKRLGTDPAKADTDGDGDQDQIDPWPDAAPRPLGDAEKVLAAVFEARHHFNESASAGIFFAPEGLAPFEMPGRAGPTMWVFQKGKRDWARPLEQCYEQGVAFIQFEDGRDASKPWQERLIRWNSERTEAAVGISIYYGGLNGTGYTAVVRRFGDEWLVVSMQMSYIS